MSLTSTELEEVIGPKPLEHVLLDQRVDLSHEFWAALAANIYHWELRLTILQQHLQINSWLRKKWSPVYHDVARHNVCFPCFFFSVCRRQLSERPCLPPYTTALEWIIFHPSWIRRCKKTTTHIHETLQCLKLEFEISCQVCNGLLRCLLKKQRQLR